MSPNEITVFLITELVFLITGIACFLKIIITPLCFMKDLVSRSFRKDAIENNT